MEITNSTAFNTIHFRTAERASLGEQVLRLFGQGNIYSGALCQALQLNIAWPEIAQLERIKRELPALDLILALTPKIVRHDSRFDIEDRLVGYKDLVECILIDPSGGTGEAFESAAVLPLYTSIKDTMKDKIVVLGGGFNGQKHHIPSHRTIWVIKN